MASEDRDQCFERVVVGLKDVGFELHQREALFPYLRFSAIAAMLKIRIVLDYLSS